MTFSEMPYQRPDLDALKSQYNALTDRLRQAADYAAAKEAFLEKETLEKHISTQETLCSIRHSIDTRDEFYNTEKKFWNAAGPEIETCRDAFTQAMLESAFRPDFEKEYGTLMFVNAELARKAFSPEIVPEMQQENDLTQEYEKLLASAQIPFEGGVYTLSQLSPFKTDADDARRLAAWQAEGRWYKEHQPEMDDIYDKLVHLRDAMGRKLGYDGYTTLGYARMQRNCYTKEDVEKFRAAVVKYLVPLADRIEREQAKRLGVAYPLSFADEALAFRSGNPRPAGDPDAILAQGKRFYDELSPETSEFFNTMLDGKLLDVLSTPGKESGGYCTSIPDYRVPFIFANFNGTQHDVEVVTHEAGHAFAAYTNRDRIPMQYVWPSLEACEVHSMSMEFFAWLGRRLLRQGCPQVPLHPSGFRPHLHPLRHHGGPLPACGLRKARHDPGPASRRLEGTAGRLHALDAPGRRDPLLQRGPGLAASAPHLLQPLLLHRLLPGTDGVAAVLGPHPEGPQGRLGTLHGLHPSGRHLRLYRAFEKRRAGQSLRRELPARRLRGGRPLAGQL